jgi:hypothetical protein
VGADLGAISTEMAGEMTFSSRTRLENINHTDFLINEIKAYDLT